jgi:hypothetical protein
MRCGQQGCQLLPGNCGSLLNLLPHTHSAFLSASAVPVTARGGQYGVPRKGKRPGLPPLVTGSRKGLALDRGKLREPAQKLWH